MKQNTIIIHALDAKVKEVEKNGKKFLVAPVVAVKEAVLNGEYAPEEELKTFVDVWNDVPVPVGHPKRRDQNVSSRHLEIIESEVIGRFYNVNWDDGKLKGEIWVDVEKAEILAKDNQEVADALEKLRNNEPMNVSTAYFSNVEQTEGTFNGVKYTGIQRDIRPDHLALLPNEKGACSLADGCGVPIVNHMKGGEDEIVDKQDKVIVNKLDKLISLFTKNKEGEQIMAEEKEQIITKIAEYKLNSFSAEELQAKELDELKTYEGLLALNLQKEKKEDKEVPEVNQEKEVEETPEIDVNAKIKDFIENELEMSIDDFKSLKANINKTKETESNKRKTLTADIVSNEDLDLTEEDCESMTINALEKLARYEVKVNYGGRGAPKVEEDGTIQEPQGVFFKNDKDGDQ